MTINPFDLAINVLGTVGTIYGAVVTNPIPAPTALVAGIAVLGGLGLARPRRAT